MNKLLNNPVNIALTLVTCAVALAFGLAGLRAVKADMQLEINTLRKLNDSTVAMLATENLEKEELRGLLVAANQLNGDLVAGIRLLVRKRDTVLVHDTLPTQVKPDSTRIATFKDSTFAGTISGTVTAPPCCAPLQMAYRVDRPEFSPSVGFVQRGDQVAATVVWQGEKVEVLSAFSKIPVKEPRLRPFVDGGVSTLLTVRSSVGVDLRLTNRWALTTYVQQDVPTNGDDFKGPQAWLMVRRKW